MDDECKMNRGCVRLFCYGKFFSVAAIIATMLAFAVVYDDFGGTATAAMELLSRCWVAAVSGAWIVLCLATVLAGVALSLLAYRFSFWVNKLQACFGIWVALWAYSHQAQIGPMLESVYHGVEWDFAALLKYFLAVEAFASFTLLPYAISGRNRPYTLFKDNAIILLMFIVILIIPISIPSLRQSDASIIAIVASFFAFVFSSAFGGTQYLWHYLSGRTRVANEAGAQ